MLVDRVQASFMEVAPLDHEYLLPFHFTKWVFWQSLSSPLTLPWNIEDTVQRTYVLRYLAFCARVCKSCAPVTQFFPTFNQQRESHNKRDKLRRSQARQSQNTPGSRNSVSPFLHHLSLLSICTYPHGLPPAISSVSFPFFIQKGQISPARDTRKLISGIWNQGIRQGTTAGGRYPERYTGATFLTTDPEAALSWFLASSAVACNLTT
ncbi:hypothetical protein QR685DRAFT_209446 [Neurospora intermedia]|uniref:Uncharacterized protein n=1 Tax=Neurospora intermedia TaxID=5142 RepID=A0ABR3DG38_NEUIN